MATGSLDANGVWIYGEDDSETTFSALLNKLGDSTSDALGAITGSQKIGKVYMAQMTATQSFSVTAANPQNLTGLSITLTPKSASSKFLIMSTVYGVNSLAGSRSANFARVIRGSEIVKTETYFSTGDNIYTLYPYVMSLLDSPATTSPITYQAQFAQNASGSAINVFINRIEASTNLAARSFLTVIEVLP